MLDVNYQRRSALLCDVSHGLGHRALRVSTATDDPVHHRICCTLSDLASGVVESAHPGLCRERNELCAFLVQRRLGSKTELRCAQLDDAPSLGSSVGQARQARSEEHTSEPQSLMRISYAVFCLK